MMLGEPQYHKGNVDTAFAHLRKSVTIDDQVRYDKPSGWMQPTRHALGALLLVRKQFEEAQGICRADLGLNETLSPACPHGSNVWSQHGLHECLRRGGETVEIQHFKAKLDRATAQVEVAFKTSRSCRKSAAGKGALENWHRAPIITSLHYPHCIDSASVGQCA